MELHETDPQRRAAEDQAAELVACCHCCPKDIKLHHFMVIAAEAALGLCIPTSPLLGENKVLHRTSLHCLLHFFEKEVIINTFQELPGLLMLGCLVHSTDFKVV